MAKRRRPLARVQERLVPIRSKSKGAIRRRVNKKDVKKEKAKSKRRVIEDAEVMSTFLLERRLRTRPANVSLSAKKKHKMLRQIRREQMEKLNAEVDSVEPKEKTKTNKGPKKWEIEDIEMVDEY